MQLEYRIICEMLKGMSNDKKQKIVDNEGGVHFRRRMRGSDRAEKMLHQYDEMGKRMCGDRIVRIDEIYRNDEVIDIYTEWVTGNTLEDILPGLSEQDAYELGVRSARLLKKIHKEGQCVINDCVTEDFIDREIDKYKEYIGVDGLCNLVKKHKSMLCNIANNTFLHADFHVGNIMLNDCGDLVLVDLEKCETGIYYRDLGLNETYNYSISPFYAEGLLKEYSNKSGFSWKEYGVNIAFFMLVYCNWKHKRNEDCSDALCQYYKRHNIKSYGEPIWMKL